MIYKIKDDLYGLATFDVSQINKKCVHVRMQFRLDAHLACSESAMLLTVVIWLEKH